jgi:hypothetical protein
MNAPAAGNNEDQRRPHNMTNEFAINDGFDANDPTASPILDPMNAPLEMKRQDFLMRAVFSEDRRLLPHQIRQAIFALERARSLNASETGTGKFLVALAMRRLIEHEAGPAVKCLYTCPKSAF